MLCVWTNALIAALICSGKSGQTAIISAKSSGRFCACFEGYFKLFLDFICKLVCKRCLAGFVSLCC